MTHLKTKPSNINDIYFIDLPYRLIEDKNIQPKWIILHCIGYNEKKSLEILTGHCPLFPVNVHYFIPHLNLSPTFNQYPIYQIVPPNKKANHAGESQWKSLKEFNNHSIGIEFHSPNYAYALEKNIPLNWCHFENFTPDQIKAGIFLIKKLMKKFSISFQNILMHSDISSWRKTDPGAFFPMETLAQAGIGIWPIFSRTRTTKLIKNIAYTQSLLKKLGYPLTISNQLDIPTLSAIRSFKLHFMPEAYQQDKIDLEINTKMMIGLENLMDKKYKYTHLHPSKAEI